MSSNTFKTPRTRFGNFHITQEASNTAEKATKLLGTTENPDLKGSNFLTTSIIETDAQPSDAISNLPTEIGLEIFALLDPVTAICLGLTNRKMYSFYLSHHDEKVVLNQFVVVGGEVLPLHLLMKDWGMRGWVYDGYCPGRFVRGAKTRVHEREKYVEPKKPDEGLSGLIMDTMLGMYSKWRRWT